MHLLTCKPAASRFPTVPSVAQIGQTLQDIGTAMTHTEAISDRSVVRPGLTALLQLRSVVNLIFGSARAMPISVSS